MNLSSDPGHEDILRFVEECAQKLTPDPLAGIGELHKQFGDDNTLKGILGLISLSYPEHQKVIHDYLSIGSHFRVKADLEKHLKHFPSLCELINSNLKLVGLLLEHKDYAKAQESIATTMEELENLIHCLQIGKIVQADPSSSVHQLIGRLSKNLNRLSDFVVIKNEDKVLLEMAALQNNIVLLGEEVNRSLADF